MVGARSRLPAWRRVRRRRPRGASRALRPARRRLEPRRSRRAAEPEVAEGAGSRWSARCTGMCTAGAFYFVNEADVVICSTTPTFFDSHVTSGMVSALEPIGLDAHGRARRDTAHRAVGQRRAVTAETALRIGLVTEVVDRDRSVGPRARDRGRHRGEAERATQGTVRAIWESLDRPYRAAMEQGLLYTPRRATRSAWREAADGPARAAAEDPLTAPSPAALSDRIASRRRPSTPHAAPSSSTAAGARGASSGARPSRRRGSWPRPAPRSASCCATGPHRSACSSACSGRAAASSRSTPAGASTATRADVAALDLPFIAGEPDDLDRLVAGRRAAATDRGRRSRRAGRPSTVRTAPRGRGASDGDRGPDADERHDRAARTHRPAYDTLERVLVGAKHYDRSQPRHRSCDSARGGGRQLTARPPRRPVPRAPVHQRRPAVRAARAVHRRRLGRRRPPPPPGRPASLVPAALRMVLDADLDPGDLGSLRSVVSGTAPLSPTTPTPSPRSYGVPVLVSYAATEFGGGVAGWNIADHREFWATKRGSVGRAHAGASCGSSTRTGDRCSAPTPKVCWR